MENDAIITEKVAAKLPNIRLVAPSDLATIVKDMGHPAYRTKQLQEWLWDAHATSFDTMSNLPAGFRAQLADKFVFNPLSIDNVQKSSDGTVKSAFKLYDGNIVEGVLIPADDRMTACVSSQVGCSLTCKFCATGYMARKRNLDAPEILDQVVAIAQQAQEDFNHPLTNIVYMGMGEPLLNYTNVLKSIDYITSKPGLGMAAKRITLSTAGIAKGIIRLAQDEVRFNLALSLHAADDVKRNTIMPINESNTLAALKDALQLFYKKTGNRITYEYILFYNFNDTLEDARKLYEVTKWVPVRVNIIEYNPIAEAAYVNTGEDKLEIFRKYLEDRGVIVNVRRSRGKDIDAACGQLANKHN